MKKEIPQGAVIGIGAAAVVGLLVVGYFMFLKQPGEVSAEETRRMMQKSAGGGQRPGGGGQNPTSGRPQPGGMPAGAPR